MMRVWRIYVYENIVQALKYSHEHMVLSTKVKVRARWDTLGRITYLILLNLLFTTVWLTIFAIRLTVTTMRLGHNFRVNSCSDYK